MLATQTLPQRRPKTMRVTFEGELPAGVTAKDAVLGLIGQVGVSDGIGHVVEYAGELVRGFSMEQRMTVCNMSIEWGARAGMIAPDETTFTYLEGRPGSAAGADWERALDEWRALPTDPDATFDREVTVDVSALAPQVTWGTNPQMVAPIGGAVPDPSAFDDPDERAAPSSGRSPTWRSTRARASRTSTSTASSSARARTRASRTCAPRPRSSAGKHVHPSVHAMVVPGSAMVKRQAEEEGLDRVFARRRLRVAPRRLLDVPGHEPGHPPAGRALRLDLEPQLRGPPGRRRAHASRQPGGGGRDGRGRALRRPAGARVKAFRRLTGTVAIVDRVDVDTDQIIPKQFLKRIERTGYGQFLFFDWMKDPEFELRRPECVTAEILIAGRNFGCGSSREHAAWALQDYGFDVVIAPSFGDIFRTNALKIGLLPVPLPAEEVRALTERCAAGAEITVDLERQVVVDPDGRELPFEIDPFARECLLEGLDEIALTLRRAEEIDRYEAATAGRVDTLALYDAGRVRAEHAQLAHALAALGERGLRLRVERVARRARRRSGSATATSGSAARRAGRGRSRAGRTARSRGAARPRGGR